VHAQRFGAKSGCSSGGTATDKGKGFNEYTCLDECKKAGKAKCNNFLIKDDSQCILYAGTCRVTNKGSEPSKVFEVFQNNFVLAGEHKQCVNPVLTTGTWTL